MKREDPPRIHNLIALARHLGVEDEEILEALRRVNPHYRVPGCPDAANGVPMDVYSGSIAGELAERIVLWVRKLVKRG